MATLDRALRDGATWLSRLDGPMALCGAIAKAVGSLRPRPRRHAGGHDSANRQQDRKPDMSATPPISFDDFLKVDIRVGTISGPNPVRSAQAGLQAADRLRPRDRAEADARPRSPGTTTSESLVGRQVAAVVNFPPRQIGKIMSEVLTLGIPDDEGEVVLLSPEQPLPVGGRLIEPCGHLPLRHPLVSALALSSRMTR